MKFNSIYELRLGNKYYMIILLHRAILHSSVYIHVVRVCITPHHTTILYSYHILANHFVTALNITLEACQSQFGFFQRDMHKFESNRLKKSDGKNRRRLKCDQAIHLSVCVCMQSVCMQTLCVFQYFIRKRENNHIKLVTNGKIYT